MDENSLREHTARCRRLAERADDATARRLLALAARGEKLLQNWPSSPIEAAHQDIPEARPK
jgi:hypothetical protein